MGFSKEISDKVLVACGRCCAICHKFCGLKIELHHIIPKSKDGPDTFENCIPLCFDCHGDMRSYDHQHPKGRVYSHAELQQHRDNWYLTISRRGHGVPLSGNPTAIVLDEPRIEAKLSSGTDISLISRLGCPGLTANIISRSSRVLKVAEIQIRLRGFDAMPFFQKGFQNDFGYTPVPEKERKKNSYYCVNLIPFNESSTEERVFEPGDAFRYMLPYGGGARPIFEKSTANNVALYAILNDETEIVLVKGNELFKTLSEVTTENKGMYYETKLPLSISLKVLSKTRPNLAAVGKTNPIPISFGGESAEPSKSLTPSFSKVVALFALIMNNWSLTKKFEYRIRPSTSIDALSPTELKSVNFWVGVGIQGNNITLQELIALFSLIQDQSEQLRDSRGNLKNPQSPSFETKIDLNPGDDQISLILSQLTFES